LKHALFQVYNVNTLHKGGGGGDDDDDNNNNNNMLAVVLSVFKVRQQIFLL
jgi:hypothetical protein